MEMLLQHEEKTHVSGQPYVKCLSLLSYYTYIPLLSGNQRIIRISFQSWESVDRSSSTFTPDITPLVLAAHKNNYEIIKILLDRGASLPMPHDVRSVFRTKTILNRIASNQSNRIIITLLQ